MKIFELLTLPIGSTISVLNEFGTASKKVAIWEESETQKLNLTTLKTNKIKVDEIIFKLQNSESTYLKNFENWYENSGFVLYPEDAKECAPGNINFIFLEIESWQILGLYLGEISLLVKDSKRIEVLVKVLTSTGNKWVHYQCSDINDDLVIS